MPKKKIDVATYNVPPQLVSYSVSATIRTGEYSNIVVNFNFEEGTLEEAVMTIDKNVQSLYDKYYNFLERPKKVEPEVPVAPVAPAPVAPKKELPQSSFDKAMSMINAAKTPDALTEIQNRITLSIQLTQREKTELISLITNKMQAYGTV